MRQILLKHSVVFILLFGGCFHSNTEPASGGSVLTHLVLCWLKDSGNQDHRNQIIEITESFKKIPGVLDARAGNPIMSDRDIVDDSFDVGIIIEVRNVDELKNYLDHPIHQKAKKDVLLPLVDRVLVYDFAK
jgi:hypothetical protein